MMNVFILNKYQQLYLWAGGFRRKGLSEDSSTSIYCMSQFLFHHLMGFSHVPYPTHTHKKKAITLSSLLFILHLSIPSGKNNISIKIKLLNE